MFSKFTKENISYYIDNKYNLDDDNSLILLLNDEKAKILNFIKNNNIDIKYELNANMNISKYCDSYFVETKIVSQKINSMGNTIIIKWNNSKNKIILKTNDENYNILLLKIKIIIYIIEYLENKKNLNIILVLTDLEKYIPNNDEIIDVIHINSGYSYNNTIFIWRYEEFEKVFFHEIIHVFRLDKRDDKTDKIINSKFENYFEAMTDIYAIIYHIIYLSLITNISPKLLLEIELSFIKNQAMLMNNIFNLNEWTLNEKITINQNSSGFSYYILKYLLLDYILKLKKKNLLKYLKNINYSILLNSIMHKKFIKYNYNNIKSLRMTLFQLKY